MKVAIFGTGGVGGYFGGLLAHAGHDVTFIARGENLKSIQARGLQVKSVNGDFTVYPASVSDDPAEVGPVEYVVVAIKHYHRPEAASALKPLIGPETTVVPLLNGVDAHVQHGSAAGQPGLIEPVILGPAGMGAGVGQTDADHKRLTNNSVF